MNPSIKKIVEEAWQTPENNFYNITSVQNKEASTNKDSYYGHLLPDKDFSIDISNQKMLASLDEKGTIKNISFFRDSYYTEDKPGTWVSNGFVQEENITSEIEFNNQRFSLAEGNHTIRYDLMYNLFPRYIHNFGSFKVLQLFLPIYLESGASVSGLIEVCALTGNDKAHLIFPRCFNQKFSDRHNVEFNYCAGKRTLHQGISWVFITDPNATFNVSKKAMENIIISSYDHIAQKYGQLEIPEKPQLAALIIRKTDSALNSISCTTDNKVVGANWGSSPVINRTWLRDMYYASLPAIYFDHGLAKRIILWFSQYEIKPQGDKFAGGIEHSVVNSLNCANLLSFYLAQTNDFEFIRNNPQMWQHVLYVVNYLIAHLDQKYGLIKSQWISDGLALGEFHIGTQITLWSAINSISNIYNKILGQPKEAKYYKEVADKLKKNIDEYCLVENEQGRKKYLEGINPGNHKLSVDSKQYETGLLKQGLDFLTRVNHHGQITLEFHDGEESDTTLAPFYGFCNVINENYLSTMKFAGSKQNPSYSSLSNGISWGNQSEATFPGYITLLMGTVDNSNEFNKRLTLLNKLADLDGSWWWWPYEVGHSQEEVSRFNHCGKCGWSDGTFSALMIKNILGIQFDAPENKLWLRPLKITPDFTWQQFPLAQGLKVNLNYQKNEMKKKITVSLTGSLKKEIEVIFQPQNCDHLIKKSLNTNNSVQLEERNV